MPKGKRMSKEDVDRLLGAIAAGAGIQLAAKLIGVTRQAIYERMKRDPKFKRKVEDARELATDFVEKALWKKAVDGHVTAMIFWLKNKRPDAWSDRRDVAIEGGGGPLKIVLEDVRANDS